MAFRSKVYYTGTGSEQNLSVTFPYLDVTHVNVSFYNPATEEYDLQERTSWSWLNSSTITLTNPDTTANGVLIWRSTGFDPLVTFTNASLLNEDDQNKAALQAVYLIEEGADLLAETRTEVGTIIITNTKIAATFVIDGGISAIVTGVAGYLQIPFEATIDKVYIFGDQTGSMVVDIWMDTYANFPPTDADSICGGNELTISAGVKAVDLALTGWTTTIPADSILAFNVDSNDTIEKVTIVLVLTKTGE